MSEIIKQNFFLLNYSKEDKNYSVLNIDWVNKKSFIINRNNNTNSANKEIKKAFIYENGKIESKTTTYLFENDEDFNEKIDDLENLPRYIENMENIISELNKINYFKNIK
jgi:hypothetical protein